MSEFHAMAPVWEPCGPGCACNDLTSICWGPVTLDVEPATVTRERHAVETDNDCRCLTCMTNRPRKCLCPDDCNCRYPWRPNYCGCAEH